MPLDTARGIRLFQTNGARRETCTHPHGFGDRVASMDHGRAENVTEEARLPPPLDIVLFNEDDEYNNP
jgi:hypothetical protein